MAEEIACSLRISKSCRNRSGVLDKTLKYHSSKVNEWMPLRDFSCGVFRILHFSTKSPRPSRHPLKSHMNHMNTYSSCGSVWSTVFINGKGSLKPVLYKV